VPAIVLTALFTAAVLVGSRLLVPLGVPRAAISMVVFTAAATALSVAGARPIARLWRRQHRLRAVARLPLGPLASAAGEASLGPVGSVVAGGLGSAGAANITRRLWRCRAALVAQVAALGGGMPWIAVLWIANVSRPSWFRALAAAFR
jgi:hypothetical protein